MAISDVLTVELGSKPAMRTKSSNAQYSKLQSEREAAALHTQALRHIGRTIEEEDRQRPTDRQPGTHQTMTADGVASLTVGNTYLNASTENPVHVSAKALDRVT